MERPSLINRIRVRMKWNKNWLIEINVTDENRIHINLCVSTNLVVEKIPCMNPTNAFVVLHRSTLYESIWSFYKSFLHCTKKILRNLFRGFARNMQGMVKMSRSLHIFVWIFEYRNLPTWHFWPCACLNMSLGA